MNSVIQELRQQPILDLLNGLAKWTVTKHRHRAELAKTWATEGQQLTKYALEKHKDCMQEAGTRSVVITHSESPIFRAQVSHTVDDRATTSVYVEANSEIFQVDCACEYPKEYGIPCFHGMRLIIAADLNPNDPRWYNPIFHVSTFTDMYSKDIPALSTLGHLYVKELLPPDHTVTAGWPKKKRYESTSEKPRTCRACGQLGHSQQTCPKPSTQIRFNNYRQQAIAYSLR